MRFLTQTLTLSSALLVATLAGGAAPTPTELVDSAIAAAGGREAFAKLGILEMQLQQEETKESGEPIAKASRAYVSTTDLESLRLEEAQHLVLVRNGDNGWAKINGTLDTRRQTPRMAAGTVNQRLFPLLLPFALTMEGVRLTDVEESEADGEPAWRLRIEFLPDFFANPVMNTLWVLKFSRKDNQILSAEFSPPADFASVTTEGVRYRIARTQTVNGVRLPAEILMEGIDKAGVESGHWRIMKIQNSVRGPWDPGLFMNPADLSALDEGDPIGPR